MEFLLYSALIFSHLSHLAVAEDQVSPEAQDKFSEDNHVIILTDDNFEEAKKKFDPILVEFYAPWCTHCKNLAPEYEKAAKMLHEKDSVIRLGKLDSTVHMKATKDASVQGFPTLKLFRSDKVIDYNGPRDAEGIVNWLEKKIGPAAEEVSSVAKAQALVDGHDIAVIGFFEDTTSDLAKAYLEEAAVYDNIFFGITASREVMDHFKTKTGTAILFKKSDESKVTYEGDFKKEFTKFLKAESMPLLIEFNEQNVDKIFSADINYHFLLFLKKSDKEAFKENLEILSEVAKEHKGEVLFVYVDGEVQDHKPIMEYFGFGENELPIYLIFQIDTQKKYFADNGKIVKANEIKEFIADFYAGKLTPFFKSQEIPDDWDKEPVKVLVGKNFEEIALDKSKDVFVMFYAPMCGHCKNLQPVWDELGKKYEKESGTLIAKIDGTTNDVENIELEGFPTLKLFKKETNEVVDYKGERDLPSLIKFLETGEVTQMKEGAQTEEKDKETAQETTEETEKEKHKEESVEDVKIVRTEL